MRQNHCHFDPASGCSPIITDLYRPNMGRILRQLAHVCWVVIRVQVNQTNRFAAWSRRI